MVHDVLVGLLALLRLLILQESFLLLDWLPLLHWLGLLLAWRCWLRSVRRDVFRLFCLIKLSLRFILSLLILHHLLVSLKRFGVLFNLASNSLILLRHLAVLESDLLEDFPNLSQGINLTNIVSSSVQELACSLLNLDSFLLVVVTVGDAATVRESVVHRELLLKLLDFELVSADEQVWIAHTVNARFVLNLHHARRELQS